MENPLMNVVELFETSSYEIANKYLDAGWMLVETYTTCYDTTYPMSKHQAIKYALVWSSKNGDVEHPKEEKTNPKYNGLVL